MGEIGHSDRFLWGWLMCARSRSMMVIVLAAVLALLGAGLVPAAAVPLTDPMLLTETTTAPNTTVVIPLAGTVTSITINWGDSTSTGPVNSAGNYSHVYADTGAYDVSISGDLLTGFGSVKQVYANQNKITSVSSFGTLGLTSLAYGLHGARTLTSVPATLPSTVTDLSRLFYLTSIFNQSLASWDTSHVTNMSGMFYQASAFNQPVGSWDTSNVTDMSLTFFLANAFNQPLASWNTSKVTTMYAMFANDSAFNQPLNAWDTSSVTSLAAMFQGAAAFNQPLDLWNTSAVTDMSSVFSFIPAFDQPLESWDTSKATTMSSMFEGSWSFNQPLDTWNTSQVTDISVMFHDARAFNQPLGTWDTSKVTNMWGTFQSALAFDQPLNTWDTSSVTDMGYLFSHDGVFNQSLSTWNTSQVTDMSSMFDGASAFNQPIGNWNVSQSADMTSMFNGATAFSVLNYDNALMGWSTQTLQPSIPLGAPMSHYAAEATSARTTLTDAPNSWTITDAGLYTPVAPTSISITNMPGPVAMGGSFTPVVGTESDGVTSVTSSTPLVCSVAEGTGVVSFVGAGSCTLVAHVAASVMWLAADGENQSVTVGKGSPSVVSALVASGIVSGQSLSSSVLSAGAMSVPGSWAFVDPSLKPAVGSAAQAVRFTPTDTANYLTVDSTVSVTVSAPPIVAPSPPRSPVASPRNHGALVSWLAPGSTGGAGITGYVVTATSKVSSATHTCKSSAAPRACTVSGLTNGTQYTFTVKATNSGGKTSTASVSTTAVTAGAPTEPRSLSVTFPKIPAHCAKVTWVTPSSAGSGAVTGYRVRWYDAVTKKFTAWVSVAKTVRSITVTGRVKKRNYRVEVQAHNSSGYSPLGSKQFKQTR